MLRAKKLLLLIFIAVIVGGCGQKSAEPPSALSQSQSDAGAASITLGEAKAICLAQPSGSSLLDKEIRTAQKQAQILAARPEPWIRIGRAWIRKARISFDPGFYLNVQACADVALNLEPNSSAALGLQALTLMNDHKFKEAQTAADEILRKTPDDLIALGIRSDALLELGQFQESAETVQQMIDVRPDMASYSRASYIRWLQGDSKGAKMLIRQALEGRDTRDPEPAAWTFVQAGLLFWNEADYDGADAVFAEALKWVPEYPQALVGRGRVALSQQQPERAIEYLEKAYRLYPLAETAWLLGDARAMQGDLKGAEKEYQRVVDEGRKSDPLTLAYFYAAKNRDPEEALRLIENERKVRNNIYVEDTYAWVLYRNGRFKEARKAIESALRLGTRDARLLYHAGVIQLAAGEANGRKFIEQALKLNPMFDATILRQKNTNH